MSQGSIDANSDGSAELGGGTGTNSNQSRLKSVRPSSKISISSMGLSQKQSYNSKRTKSPERIAREQYHQAKEYEKKMLSRVNYLAKEENKFMKKIEKTRDDAMRLQSIKQSKISHLH